MQLGAARKRLLLALVSFAANDTLGTHTHTLLFQAPLFQLVWLPFLHLSAVSVFVQTSAANDCMVALRSM